MNYKNKITCFILLIAAVLFNPAVSTAQKVKYRTAKAAASEKQVLANSLLWEVSGNGLKQPSYLFGTFHLLNDSYLNTVPEVKQSFDKSKGVVVETELDSSRLAELAPKMVMTDNKISNLISAEDFALVDAEVKQAMGYELKMLDQMKPMSLLMLLSVTEYQKAEVLKQYTGSALDAYFANQGRKDGKKITRLETMEQQFDLLYNQHSVEKQAVQLVGYVRDKETSLKVSDQITKLYFDKNLSKMWDESEAFNKVFFGDEDMAYMVDDRNKNWMKQLPGLMKEQSTFVAVGALHLPGPNGLIVLLQRAGYTVKPLQ